MSTSVIDEMTYVPMAWVPKRLLDRIEATDQSLTFAELRAKVRFSEIDRDEVNLATWFTRHVPMLNPGVSSPMESVSGVEMCIGMAMNGGLGILHNKFTPAEQAEMAKRVKYHLNGLIERPYTYKDNQTLADILKICVDKRRTFRTFPIVNAKGKLVGLLTKKHFEMFADEMGKTAGEVMHRDVVTGKPGISIIDAYAVMKEHGVSKLPLADGHGKLKGLYVWKDVASIVRGNAAQYNVDAAGRLRVGAAVGTRMDDALTRGRLLRKHVDVLVIDTAHGNNHYTLNVLKALKKAFPELDVMAGNVSEPEEAVRLVKAGADGIRVGQGGGSICSTRIVAGIGCPQASAIYNVSKAINALPEEERVPICADGGLIYSGDLTIALALGANSCMMGNMLAGTDESAGETVRIAGSWKKFYFGEGSKHAMSRNAQSRERYGQVEVAEVKKLVAEGIASLVDATGLLADVLHQYYGGLRVGMEYIGAVNIQELWKRGDFRRLSQAGYDESKPHDVEEIKGSPLESGVAVAA